MTPCTSCAGSCPGWWCQTDTFSSPRICLVRPCVIRALVYIKVCYGSCILRYTRTGRDDAYTCAAHNQHERLCEVLKGWGP
jgi:hypothetical protein